MSMKLDVDQAGEFKAALRRERGSDGSEWTPERLKAMCEQRGFLGRVLDVLDGRAEIVEKTPDDVTQVVVQKATTPLRFVREVALFATPEKKASEVFSDTRRYQCRPNFWDEFPEICLAGIKGRIGVYENETGLTFKEIMCIALGLESSDDMENLNLNAKALALPQIENLAERDYIDRAESAENNSTGLVRSRSNYFLVVNKDEGLVVVEMFWNFVKSKWYITDHGFDDRAAPHATCRLFFRK